MKTGQQLDIRPEPARRVFGCEDAEFIAQRIIQIREDAKPRCKLNGNMSLTDCLRSPTKCGENCPDRDYWTGPQVASS